MALTWARGRGCAGNGIGDDAEQAVDLLLKRNEKIAADKAAAEELAEKAAAAKKAADVKAEAEKAAAAKAENEKTAAAAESRGHELENQLAATLAAAKAMAERDK